MKNSILLKKADFLAKESYRISKMFSNDELFCLTSQLRRAALSVVLNIIEGFARITNNEKRRFFTISYASLKEVKYLLYFAYGEKYLEKADYIKIISLLEEIGKILWAILKPLN